MTPSKESAPVIQETDSQFATANNVAIRISVQLPLCAFVRSPEKHFKLMWWASVLPWGLTQLPLALFF